MIECNWLSWSILSLFFIPIWRNIRSTYSVWGKVEERLRLRFRASFLAVPEFNAVISLRSKTQHDKFYDDMMHTWQINTRFLTHPHWNILGRIFIHQNLVFYNSVMLKAFKLPRISPAYNKSHAKRLTFGPNVGAIWNAWRLGVMYTAQSPACFFLQGSQCQSLEEEAWISAPNLWVPINWHRFRNISTISSFLFLFL